MARASKGSAFEREFCRSLSTWWAGNEEDDDLFWRTSQSGGRATMRDRKGKTTRGHCGDICATNKDGEPLTSLITFELKRGYNRATVGELLDRPKKAKPQVYEVWMEQAKEAARKADTRFWMIVHQRDRREPLILFPTLLLTQVEKYVGWDTLTPPYFMVKLPPRKGVVVTNLSWLLSEKVRTGIKHIIEKGK